MTKNIIDWWLDFDKLTDEELFLVQRKRPADTILQDNHKDVVNQFFNMMPFCNISSETHKIEVSENARDMISHLFQRYVDDDTLVIYSNCEHGCVEENVSRCKNSLQIFHDTEIQNINLNRILDRARNYKKAFVYVIGTQISNGQITPQIFYTRLKEGLVSAGIECIMVCDDVHGMFITPRDYSYFDYIIGTAHALVIDFDMGILITKNESPTIGKQYTNWLEEYIKSVSIVLSRRTKLDIFYKVMVSALEHYTTKEGFELLPNITPNIFALKLKRIPVSESIRLKLREYQIKIEGYNRPEAPYFFIRSRAQQFITRPELLKPGLELLQKYLDASLFFTQV